MTVNGIGDKNHVHVQGRIAYGIDPSDGNAYPLQANSSGYGIYKTIQTELLASVAVAASTNVVSSTLSLTGVKRATFFVDHGRASTAAFGTNGTEYRVEVSEKASGNETWRPIASVLASSAVCSSAAASATVAIGSTLVTITSGTAMVNNDIVCWTSGTIEWSKITAVTGTASFQVLDSLTYNHASATGLFGSAEEFIISLNTEAVTRARVIVNNSASGTTQAIVSRIACITEQ